MEVRLQAQLLRTAVALILISGCGVGKARQDATRFMESHYALVARSQDDLALAKYSTAFYERTTRDEWRTMLQAVRAQLGVLVSHRIVAVEVSELRGAGAGQYVVLTCEVSYERGRTDETFTLFREHADGDFSINAHSIKKRP
jgi:hypothetical protein